MMVNNWQRLNIWSNLNNKFDYIEYTIACKSENIEPQSPMEFAQKAGMVSCAITAFPELSAGDAYLKFIQDNQQETPTPSRGLGDTVAKITHATGLDKLSEMYTSITGKDCGCASRQEALNKLVPYGVTEE